MAFCPVVFHCTDCSQTVREEVTLCFNIKACVGSPEKVCPIHGASGSKMTPPGAAGRWHMAKSWRPKLQNRCLAGWNTFE